MQPTLAIVGSIREGNRLRKAILNRFDLGATLHLDSCDGSVVSVRLVEHTPPHDLAAMRQFSEGFAIGYRAAKK